MLKNSETEFVNYLLLNTIGYDTFKGLAPKQACSPYKLFSIRIWQTILLLVLRHLLDAFSTENFLKNGSYRTTCAHDSLY